MTTEESGFHEEPQISEAQTASTLNSMYYKLLEVTGAQDVTRA